MHPFFLFEGDATPHTTYFFPLRLVSNIKISEENLVLCGEGGVKKKETTSNHQEVKLPPFPSCIKKQPCIQDSDPETLVLIFTHMKLI